MADAATIITPTTLTIHKEGDRLFDERNITVRLEDEAAGPFLIITNNEGSIKLDLDEWPYLNQAVTELIKHSARFEDANA